MFLKLFLLLYIFLQNIFLISSEDYVRKFLENGDKNEFIKIDFLIIQNLSIEPIDRKEKWKELQKFIFSSDLLFIKDEPTTYVYIPKAKPTKELNIPELNFDYLDKKNENKKRIDNQKKLIPFLYERVPFQEEIRKIESNLNRSKDYRVLYYNSWFQPALTKNESLPVFIEAIKKDKKTYGEITIYKERFLHLKSKIRLAQKTNNLKQFNEIPELIDFQALVEAKKVGRNKKSNNENYWVDTIFNTVKLNFKYLGEFIYKENNSNSAELIERPKYRYQDLYEIEKDTKLEINEFNFIDHPYFSILIRITESPK